MELAPEWIKFTWNLKNFCFSNFYRNMRLSSPAFEVRTPDPSKWKLYMFPNGWGPDNYVGIFLSRKRCCQGPESLRVLFRIWLVDQNGELYPEESDHEEQIFGRGDEYGYNEILNRSDIKSDSRFISDDTLTVYCEFKIIDGDPEATVPAHQPRANHEDYKDTKRICRAMKFMLKESIHSDITMHGSDRNFHVHRCILERRLPILCRELEMSPEKVYENDSVIEVILLYAYTGELDFKTLGWWNIPSVLMKYGLSALEDRSHSTQCITANTYFVINKRTFKWTISQQQLRIKYELSSHLIVDHHNHIRFMAFLTKNEGNLWKISIAVFSGDESFIRWKVTLGDEAQCFEEGESSVTNGLTPIQCSSVLSLQNTALHVNERFAQVVVDNFTLTLDIAYPMCEANPNSNTELQSVSTSSQPYQDTHRLLQSLEAMYSGAVGDIIVRVQNTDRSFKVHKCIISSRSAFFRKTLEQDMVERIRNEILLRCPFNNLADDFFADIVDKLLLYIYCGKREISDEEFEKYLQDYLDFCLVGE